jgi:hypothetical protein
MINTTGHILALSSRANLHEPIQNAIAVATNLIEAQSGKTNLNHIGKFSFARLLGIQNQVKTRQFDQSFLDASLQFCLTKSQHIGATSSLKVLQTYVKHVAMPATAFASLTRGLKLMLFELWRVRVLLLPTVFSPGPHFPYSLFDHPMLTWLQRFDPASAINGEGSPKRRLFYYGPRLLAATDWIRPEDVSLQEVAALHRARVMFSHGTSETVIAGGTQIPFSLFIAQLHNDFPDSVGFTMKELEDYSRWSLSRSIGDITLEEFVVKPKLLKARNRKGPAKPSANKRPDDHAAIVINAVREQTHDAIIHAFRSLQRGRPDSLNWQKYALPCYPGREFVDLNPIAPNWIRTFRAYLRNRKKNGHRKHRDAIAALNLLCDYLFFYLPLWIENHADGKLSLPRSPKEFSRLFVSREMESPVCESPATLLDVIAERRSGQSLAVALRQLHIYFDFVEEQFGANAEIAGPTFINPISVKFDVPRTEKRSKTSKKVIPNNIWGHLLFYFYAVEAFGEYLQRLALSGELPPNRKDLRTKPRFSSDELGFVPIFSYRGRIYAIHTVPNVFNWAQREFINGKDEGTVSTYMPHISALRMLIVSLENGLRLQSVQWLDRKSWDSLNLNAQTGRYIYWLFINTDKSKTDSWRAPVVYRVRDLLKREQNFQECCADVNENDPVNYEKLDDPPFAPIRPLFRSASTAYPVSDSMYREAWKGMMIAFGEFFREATGAKHVSMVEIHSVKDSEDKPIERYEGDDENEQAPYSVISILSSYTPHSCRATFTTNRVGILGIDERSAILGITPETTGYYTKLSDTALFECMQLCDETLISDYRMFDSSSIVHIRADRPDSALVRSFAKDREGTIGRFRFVSPIALWTTKEDGEKQEGLELLVNSPMSQIRFRETHICPVGEECPSDIVLQIGAPKRCGICPLAMKCVDHLTAIAAKKNQLFERIGCLNRQRLSLKEMGEPSPVLDELWEAAELDASELVGWTLNEELLIARSKEVVSEGTLSDLMFVERPEFVRRHLQKVTRVCSTSEFLLHRIADCNAYPGYATPQTQAVAARMKRQLLADERDIPMDVSDNDLNAVLSVSKMLNLMMKSSGLSISEISARFEEPQGTSGCEPLLSLLPSEHG